LSYLQKFPVDVLKIDQSFVRDLNTNSNNAKLVSSIIDLGKSLNLSIIAEGVETAEQLNFLKLHRCEEGQGFYFSKALEPEAFIRFLADSLPRHPPRS
jgi:sensor c-di-GMP phosphodiesterase-like protein